MKLGDRCQRRKENSLEVCKFVVAERKERGPRSSADISRLRGATSSRPASSTKTSPTNGHPCQRPSLPRPPPTAALARPSTSNSTFETAGPSHSLFSRHLLHSNTQVAMTDKSKNKASPFYRHIVISSSTKKPSVTLLQSQGRFVQSAPCITHRPRLTSPTLRRSRASQVPNTKALTQPRQPRGLNEACSIPGHDWATRHDNALHSPN